MTIILTSDELEGVSGYRSSKRQLSELHRQGFYRARTAPRHRRRPSAPKAAMQSL